MPSVLLALVLSIFGSQPQAAASRPARATLDFPPCSSFAELEVKLRAAVGLELEAEGMKLVEGDFELSEGDVLLEVEADCSARLESAVLRVGRGPRKLERALSLRDVPPRDQARTLALGLAELIHTLAEELRNGGETETSSPTAPATAETVSSATFPEEVSEEPRPSSETPTSSPVPLSARATGSESSVTASKRKPLKQTNLASRAEHEFRLSAAPEMRWFLSGSSLWGGRVQLERGLWFAGADLLFGWTHTDLGAVSADVQHLVFGIRAVSKQFGQQLRFETGPRIGFGRVHLTGSPQPTTSPSDPWISADGRATFYLDGAWGGMIELRLARAVCLAANVELGAARGARALVDGRRVSAYEGLLAGADFSLRLGL